MERRKAKGNIEPDENWRDIPIKKEVIIINLESTVKNEFIMYDISRIGHKVSDNGDFIDNIELTKIEGKEMFNVGGSLTGISKYFWMN